MKLIIYDSGWSKALLIGLRIFMTAIGIMFFFTGCQKAYLPSDLIRYVQNPDHGLKKTKKIGALEYELQYKPISYIIANEFRSNAITEEDYQKRLDELKDLQYYNLKIGVKDGRNNITTYQVSNQEEQQNRLFYLSFRLKDDIRLVQGKDTLSPVLCHFERNYDLANYRTFVMAFKNFEPKESPSDRTFIIHSDEIDTGIIKMKIEEKAIQNTPSIKLQ